LHVVGYWDSLATLVKLSRIDRFDVSIPAHLLLAIAGWIDGVFLGLVRGVELFGLENLHLVVGIPWRFIAFWALLFSVHSEIFFGVLPTFKTALMPMGQ